MVINTMKTKYLQINNNNRKGDITINGEKHEKHLAILVL